MNLRNRSLCVFTSALSLAAKLQATQFHVAAGGLDSNPGSLRAPFRTIQCAAEAAQPGDLITVHEGVYREAVAPPRGGESDAKRITYEAARGEQVIITGSEPVKSWTQVTGTVWRIVISNSFFGSYNPFGDLITGDWFHPQGRQAHTGMVYLNGHWLTEARALADVFDPKRNGLFFAEVGPESTAVHARFSGKDPNKEEVEVNVRQTVFYPATNHINYITVRGFTLQHAAPNWAPPTVEQKAIIGPNWAKGWIIESNVIRYSSCSGVSLGKFADVWDKHPGGPGYNDWNRTIDRALKNGWNKQTVGHHIVRNNEIYDCDEAGIIGAFGCAYSVIEKNHIHDVAVRGLFGGAELAGIKFHGAVDTLIRDNWIHHCIRGMHMDWMTQGTQITGNLMHNNEGKVSDLVGFHEAGGGQDLFLEVNHGPCVVANNLLLSGQSVFNASHGTLFAHNLMRGVSPTEPRWLPRETPWLEPHGTTVAGQYNNRGGDDRFFNNIFTAKNDLAYFNTKAALPVMMEGNVFTRDTTPAQQEETPLLAPEFEPEAAIKIRKGEAWLRLATDAVWGNQKRRLVTGEMLGKTATASLPFENPDGTPLMIDSDYFGHKRAPANPFPGPIDKPVSGEIRVWPK